MGHRMVGTMNHNQGKYIGVESNKTIGGEKAPVYHSLRLDWDAEKGPPHYNMMVHRGGFSRSGVLTLSGL
jgi:hypothetical protein